MPAARGRRRCALSRLPIVLALSLATAGCGTLPTDQGYRDHGKGVAPVDIGPAPRPIARAPGVSPDAARAGARLEPGPSGSTAEYYDPGTGRFVRSPGAAAPPPQAKGDVTLNFENTNLLEVIKVVLGDLLGHNYVIDPQVQGTVTLQTSEPLSREDLLPTLAMLLRMNGAALVERAGTYQVLPLDQATRGRITAQLGGAQSALPRGYGVRILPLRFVSATEMQQILEPFAPPGAIVRVDIARNLLVLAGTPAELDGMTDTVRVFDVDWLDGMSVALFTPDFVDAKTLADELNNVFNTSDTAAPLTGLLRIVPIERLNALLVVTPQPQYLGKVREWVARLDRDTGAVGQRLYIYQVENGKASDVAEVLTQVFEDDDSERRRPAAQLAPGLESVEIESPETDSGDEPAVSRTQRTAAFGGEANGFSIDSGPVKIIPDDINNALVIKATADQYRQIVQALRRLDAVPMQVFIEATIAEVSLNGDLSLGLEWFFNNKVGGKQGIGTLDLGAAGIEALAPGFSYAITTGGGDPRVVLNVLSEETKVNVVSSPTLMVLNNQEASIQVGDEVPVTTQQQQGTDTGDRVLQNVEFRDTGVLLTVTPRVNSGGLVVMEIEQEVSDLAPGSGGSLTPTIQQRKINSTVAVQSGETIALGGLIRDNARNEVRGIPGLVDIPILGLLFGNTIEASERTELVVLITPRAVQGAAQSRKVTDAFRSKMESLKPFERGGYQREFGPLRIPGGLTQP
ncbi:MAG: type II secretion system secretin GspD [Gammaproteobacteria bacterium]